MEEIKSPVCLCSACRKASTGGDISIKDGCPLCGSDKVSFILDPSSLVSHHENSMAFGLLCSIEANSDDVADIAEIMGFEGGCTQARKDSSCIGRLAQWMSENGM